MRKNNKGFVVTEVLILSTIIIGVLIFMYSQFKNINRSYQYSFKYDTVEGMYLANNIVNYINNGNFDKLVNLLNNNQKGYIDITECNIENSNLIRYCETLFEKSEVEKVLFAEEDLSNLKQNMDNIDNEFKDYINQIKTNNSENDYRIIVKYKNGTFATMRFNKENTYVSEGLIAHLDGINNTGNGHSNETQIWKDLSNHGNDATLYNNPSWSNNSLTFDGQTNYGRLENTANIDFPNGTTWEARMKLLSLTGVKENGNINLLGNWKSGGGGIFFNNSNILQSNLRADGAYISTTNSGSNYIGEYYTVAFAYDYTNLNLYIDGQLISSIPNNKPYVISILPITLAGEPNVDATYLSNYANIELQNVLIYDRALTENEVMRNYQADLSRY